MSFIVQKAFRMQPGCMRGLFLTFGTGIAILAAGMSPDTAFAREPDQPEAANCTCPKNRQTVLRPLTEARPIRKGEKVRVRRILM